MGDGPERNVLNSECCVRILAPPDFPKPFCQPGNAGRCSPTSLHLLGSQRSCFCCQSPAACAVTLCWVMLLDIVFFTFALGQAWKEGGGRVYSSTLRSGLFSLLERESLESGSAGL